MNKTNIWRPIEITDDIIIKAREEGLVGIEECVNYNINTVAINKNSDNKRRKNSDHKFNKNKRVKSNDPFHHKLNRNFPKDSLSPSRFGSTTEIIHNAQKQAEVDHIELGVWNSFDLPKPILKGLNKLNFNQPTPIQSLTLPAAILGRRDVLGASETGSGKTLAFGLPILAGILEAKNKSRNKGNNLFIDINSDEDNNSSSLSDTLENGTKVGKRVLSKVKTVRNKSIQPLYALILTPTRELAIQVKNHLDAVAIYTGIKITAIVGGMASVKQERLLSEWPEIVVATPGRLWELIQQGNAHLSQLDNIRYLVIDETDRMLEKGHFQELHDLLERINLDSTKKQQRQNFVFSATLTLVHELPDYLRFKVNKKPTKIEEMTSVQKLKKIVDMLGITNPKVVDITQGRGTSATLTECRISCDVQEKDYYVYYFIKKHPGKTLIFCNTIGCVRRLCTLLSLLDCHPLPLHASMPQRQRLKSLERFKDVDNSILIATDIAARGLDIPCVEHVLHYQTPRTSESYVHRSGRTARASQQGITVLLIGLDEIQNYLKICKTLGKDKDLPTFPVEDNLLKSVKQRVNLAREIDKLQLHVRKTNSETGWFKKMAKDMDIIIDVKKKYDFKEAKEWKELADLKRKQLASLLATSLFPVGISRGFSLNTNSLSMFIEKPCSETRAIDIIKNAKEDNFKQRKKISSLYKMTKRSSVKRNNETIRLGKNKNSKKGKKKLKNK